MINPQGCDTYAAYVERCKLEAEVPANEATWNGWKYPIVLEPKPKLTLKQRIEALEAWKAQTEGGK